MLRLKMDSTQKSQRAAFSCTHYMPRPTGKKGCKDTQTDTGTRVQIPCKNLKIYEAALDVMLVLVP